MTGTGRWASMTLRKPKRQKGEARRKPAVHDNEREDEYENSDLACHEVSVVEFFYDDLLLYHSEH